MNYRIYSTLCQWNSFTGIILMWWLRFSSINRDGYYYLISTQIGGCFHHWCWLSWLTVRNCRTWLLTKLFIHFLADLATVIVNHDPFIALLVFFFRSTLNFPSMVFLRKKDFDIFFFDFFLVYISNYVKHNKIQCHKSFIAIELKEFI